jgi:hypothetical protein
MDALIDIIADVAKVILWLAVIIAALVYMFSPSQGRGLLIRIVWVAFGLSVALVALWSLALSLAGISWVWLLLPLAVGASVIAHWIRAVRRPEHKTELRGAERTPLVPQHLNEEDDQQ